MTNVQRQSLNRFLFDGGPKDIYSISPDVEISQMKKKKNLEDNYPFLSTSTVRVPLSDTPPSSK